MNDFERLLLDHGEQMMLLVEPEGLHLLAVNKITQLTLGYSAPELLAKRISDIESALPDVFYWEDVRNGVYQEITSNEGLFLCADGSMLPVSKSIRLVKHQDKTLLLVQASILQDDLKIEDDLAKTLSQLRATLESTGSGILVIDWQGRIANMNRLFSSMWDIPQELLLRHDDAAMLDFVAASVVESDICRSRLHEIVGVNETRDIFKRHDGQMFECRSRPQYLDDEIIGRVFGFDDITERERAAYALRESRDLFEERVLARTAELQAVNAALLAEKIRQAELIKKLAEAQAQLLQSEKMASVGQLAAGVAHEINNPVGFVNSNLGTLQRYVKDLLHVLTTYEQSEAEMLEETRDALLALKEKVDMAYLRQDIDLLLTESVDGLQRVKTIVRDLKNFSRADAHEMELANIEQGLESTLNVAWNELKYKAEIIKEYERVGEVKCNLAQLNQVFMNLLVNAVHAIEEHGQITLRTGQDSESIWVEVEDTGKGIAAEHIDHIFEPFFTTKPVGKGTGLGLSLSYGIVQQHGGRIDVSSTVGKGSIFRVVLPRPVKTPAVSEKTDPEPDLDPA